MAKLELYHIYDKPFQFKYHWNQHKIHYNLTYLSVLTNTPKLNFE